MTVNTKERKKEFKEIMKKKTGKNVKLCFVVDVEELR